MFIKKALVVSAMVVAAVGCSTVDSKAEKTDFARKAISPYVENGQLPGAISVFYNNGVQETACLGYADPETKRPITMDDPFMQCSQTKGFCGVTVAMLVEEGKISLDDPVSKYLPEFKTLWVESKAKDGSRVLKKAKNVLTVRMVMNHTGGFPFELPEFKTMGGWSRRMPLRSVAATAASQPIMFEPGTRVQYSNVGIDIGAAVVEKVSGMRWEDFLKKRVFEPLGMKDSGFWPSDEALARRIWIYECRKNQPAKRRGFDPAMQPPFNDDRVFSSAGAGLWTTANDQLKFYKMLMNLGVGDNGVRILKEETVKAIRAVSTRPKGKGGYSLGLTAPEADAEDQWFGHGGAWGTNCMVNWHKKQLKLWVVQLVGGPRPWDKAKETAADAFFKANIDNSDANAYTGRMN